MAYTKTPEQSTYQQKQLSFFGQPNPRNGTSQKDVKYVNVFGESWATKTNNDVLIYLRKRAGMSTVLTLPNAPIRGVYQYQHRYYFAVGANIYSYINGVLTHFFTIGSFTGPVAFTYFQTATEDLIVFGDGTTMWQHLIDTLAVGPVAGGYPTPYLPCLETIDGMLLMVKQDTADIYNSDIESLTGWDFTTAEMYPDTIVWISRYNNYLVAMGMQSTELFYNAAITTGSPFVRNESAVLTVGCAAPWTALQTDRRFFWIGQTGEGEYTVWMMEDFKSEEIATPFVKQRVNADAANITEAYGYSVRSKGHQFYVLRLTLETWVYDTREKLWHQWTYADDQLWPATHCLDSMNGYPYLFAPGMLYRMDATVTTDAGVPIRCSWTTTPLDFDTMNRKFFNRLTIVGNTPTPGPQTLTVDWSDDDYQTYSAPRTIDFSLERPAIVNMGYARRRSYRFRYTGDTDLRLDGFELTYNLGVN